MSDEAFYASLCETFPTESTVLLRCLVQRATVGCSYGLEVDQMLNRVFHMWVTRRKN